MRHWEDGEGRAISEQFPFPDHRTMQRVMTTEYYQAKLNARKIHATGQTKKFGEGSF